MKRIVGNLYFIYIQYDPGFVRIEKAALALLSFLSTWAIMRGILQVLTNQLTVQQHLKVVLFAPVLSLICSIVITDLSPVDRRNSLLLSILPIAAVIASFTLLPVITLLYALILLILFFFSYYFRRYGIRSMELFLLATITFYFSALLGTSWTTLPWFLLAALVSIFSVYLWRFVLWPYNPERLLRRTNAAYYRQAYIIVKQIQDLLHKESISPGNIQRLNRGMSQIAHCRSVIESELAALTPPFWTREKLDRLRIDFYNAGQGLNVMIQAVTSLASRPVQIPSDLRQILLKTLEEFQQVLIKIASPQSLERLEQQMNLLRNSLEVRVTDSSANIWALPLLRLLAGGSQINQAVKDARDVASSRRTSTLPTPGSSSSIGAGVGNQPSRSLKSATPAGPQRFSFAALHPTTILGLQAFLAVLLAMLVGYFFSLDHSNWIFWTAFVVIAGSTGESLRRISFRVFGTVIGVLIGVLISLALSRLDASSTPVIGLVAACLFLAVYFVDTSYTWMMLWINIGITLLFIGLGGTVSDILVTRPLNTFIGAAIAAMVVIFVLPIRTRDRFKRSLIAFINALDQYMASYIGQLLKKSPSKLDAASIQLMAQFTQLEKTFPSLALEYNPLARAQTPLLQLSTILQALKMDLLHMKQDMDSGLIPVISQDISNLILLIHERIHANIAAIINLQNKKPTTEVRNLADLFTQAHQVSILEKAFSPQIEENPNTETHVLIYLARVNQALLQVASDLQEA